MMSRRLAPLIFVLLSFLASDLGPIAVASDASDREAARRLFEANLDAIRKRDRAAYLECYLQSETLTRAGPDGIQLGFEPLARQTGSGWPDFFTGEDLRLVVIRPGLVYGIYRYRVRYGEDEQTGLSERFFLKTSRGWKIAVTTAFPAPSGTAPPPRALVGATLIDGTGSAPVPDSVVLLRDGKIACAAAREACPFGEEVTVMNLEGHWITPGLVDAHVHFSQTGWADGRPDALDLRDLHPYEEVQSNLRNHPEQWFRSYLCSGITAVFDVGGYPWTWTLRELAELNTRAPHVAATGPLVSTWDFWLNLPGERQFMYLADEEAARAQVRFLASRQTDAVKIWFIPVQERDFDEMSRLVRAAGEEARRRDLPLIVHATGLREAKIALQAGAQLLVHGVGDRSVDEDFLSLAREQKTFYCPTLTVANGYQALNESVLSGIPVEIDDPNGCVDAATRERIATTPQLGAGRVEAARAESRKAWVERVRTLGRENLLRVHQAGISVVTGTDAGNPLTLHGPAIYAEMEAMVEAGLTPAEVIVASTLHGAKVMGREKELGTVERGKQADLLVLSADPSQDIANFRKLRYVIRGGEVRGLEELRAP